MIAKTRLRTWAQARILGGNFKEVSNYSSYRGYKTYIKADSAEFPKFILFLDWYQVLDRSRTEGTWNDKFPEDSITFLNRLKGAAEETWGHRDALSIVIVSHIEHSSKKSGQSTSNLQSIQTDCGRRPHHIDFYHPRTLWGGWEGSYNKELYPRLSDPLRIGRR